MEFFTKSKICVSRHTPSASAPNLGAVLFHACTHMRTRARNAHARARAHMRVIYILVVAVVVEQVEKFKVIKITRYHVRNKKNSQLKILLKTC